MRTFRERERIKGIEVNIVRSLAAGRTVTLSTLISPYTINLQAPQFLATTQYEAFEVEMKVMTREPKEALPMSELSEREAIIEVITRKADEFGVNKSLAIDLASFESGFDPEVKSKISSATGLYQFVIGTWEGHCAGERMNPGDNAGCAMRLISEGGISHWLADPNTKSFLIQKGYVECLEICKLKPYLLTKR